jgi:hypothetical protein
LKNECGGSGKALGYLWTADTRIVRPTRHRRVHGARPPIHGIPTPSLREAASQQLLTGQVSNQREAGIQKSQVSLENSSAPNGGYRSYLDPQIGIGESSFNARASWWIRLVNPSIIHAVHGIKIRDVR